METPDLPTERENDTRRLRLIILLPCAWLVLGMIAPNFILSVWRWEVPFLLDLTDTIGILLVGGAMAYLLVRIRKERFLVGTALASVGFLLLSVCIKLLLALIPPSEPARYLFQRCEVAFNGLGFAAMIFAFFYAIADLLLARSRIETEQALLSQEMTRRERTEAALRASERRYRTVVEDQTEIISRFKPDGTLLFVNDVFCRFFGKLQAELLGIQWRPFAVEEDVALIEEKLRTLSSANPVVLIENRVYSGGGQIRWMQFVNRGFFDAEGVLTEIQAVGRDITERNEAESALRENEKLLRFMIETVEDVFWRMTPDMRFTYISPAVTRQQGYAPEGVIGHSLMEFLTPNSAKELSERLANRPLIQPERVDVGLITYEFELRRKDGSLMWCEAIPSRVTDANGAIIGYQGVTRDITRRRRAETLLAEERAHLAENARLVSLGIMAGGVAHEINNPLAIIAGCAEQLEAYGIMMGQDNLAARLVPVIRRNASRIQETIQGLRALSRDASHDPFAPARVEGIIRSTATLCHERFQLNGVKIEIEADPSLTIECRSPQISQVLLNLLNNAFDAVRDAPEKWIRVSVTEQPNEVELSVEDSGSGIPAEIADRLFVPFFTTKSEQYGLGLGLSISHAIVQAHHGEMAVDRSCNHTRFLVHLPKRQPVNPD